MASLLTHLTCLDCGHANPANPLLETCESCGGTWLEASYDLARLPADWPQILKERPASLWRYEELLPLSGPEIVTMGEGWTPLVATLQLKQELGLKYLYIKDERQSPTGSFKDRQGVLAINALRQAGINELALASTGNKAAAYAAYCARAGIRLWIFLTSMVPNEKLRELALYGAEVIKIAGTYDQAKQVARDFAKRRGIYYDPGLNALVGREGLKTIAYEIAEQLAQALPLELSDTKIRWRAPDWYLQAVSGGIGPIAIYNGFLQLQELGLIDRIPQLGLIQIEGCSPMVAAWQANLPKALPVTPRTRITVLSSGDPGRGYEMLRAACLSTGGTMIAVDDGEAFRAMRRMARIEGYSAEPAAAVAFAGLEKMVSEGLIKPEEIVVVNCSGHTFPAEKHILEDQYVLDLQLGQQALGQEEKPSHKPEEGLSAALERLDEQVTTIVVIDDNPQDSRLIRRLLQSYKNYRIFEAQNPRDGLDLVRYRKPDLVISDLTMPDMDGFDLLRSLKADPETSNIPVIVISAKTLNKQDQERLRQADSVWQKGSFNTRQLVDHVVKTLGGRGDAPNTLISVQEVVQELTQALEAVTRSRVLVIDDNRKDARLIKRILEATQNFEVHEAYSAQEALENFAALAPRLVVLDLLLPDMKKGHELVDNLRAQPGFSSLPIIVLTAKDPNPEETSYLKARDIPILRKAGLDRKALVDYVTQVLNPS
jgi:threonine synthase